MNQVAETLMCHSSIWTEHRSSARMEGKELITRIAFPN